MDSRKDKDELTYCVVTFHTTNYALDFEKKIKAMNLQVKLIPTPRELSSSCGLAAKVECSEEKHIVEICESKKIEISGFHKLQAKKKRGLLDRFLSTKDIDK